MRTSYAVASIFFLTTMLPDFMSKSNTKLFDVVRTESKIAAPSAALLWKFKSSRSTERKLCHPASPM